MEPVQYPQISQKRTNKELSRFITNNYPLLKPEDKISIMRMMREFELYESEDKRQLLYDHSDGIRVKLSEIPTSLVLKIEAFMDRII